MGVMRFLVFAPGCITAETVRQAYLSGIDRTAWQVQSSMEGGQLVLRRAVSESANLHIPWPVAGRGRVTLSTTSLMEQPEPYDLVLELARGTIGQLRNQLAEWQTAGLSIPETVTTAASEATRCLGRAAVGPADRQASAERAERAIRTALDAADTLVRCYVEQATVIRRRTGVGMPVLFGGELGRSPLDGYTAKQFLRSFNAAVVPACWREIEASEGSYYWTLTDKQVEWCKGRGVPICGGPLLQLDPQGLPDWLYLWEDDFDNLGSFVLEFVQSTILRYHGKVDLWQCAARLNSAEVLSLSEEEKLRLAVSVVELAHSIDPQTPSLISFDQPWAEYMSRRELDFPPLHFADALIRAGLNLGGLMLEVNLDCHPGGTLPRTPLEFSRQLDYWSVLGLPLYVSITVPSGWEEDPLARRRASLPPGSWTPESQRAWVGHYLPLILSKPSVRGVFWGQLRDGEPHDFPHGGLFDPKGRAKPALGAVAAVRREYVE